MINVSDRSHFREIREESVKSSKEQHYRPILARNFFEMCWGEGPSAKMGKGAKSAGAAGIARFPPAGKPWEERRTGSLLRDSTVVAGRAPGSSHFIRAGVYRAARWFSAAQIFCAV